MFVEINKEQTKVIITLLPSHENSEKVLRCKERCGKYCVVVF